ncbi:hypothetical protein AVEN_122625-1 [Araneus ventricosus]|uniref:Reverse transcriptase domain-containing protein n=1 Tax=Araneus ventricosus TaxID=182803 RepID=A0A4Y2FLA3_ARAVE|nr:hypothetical protein AVEN_122625-1 [Araneus ventricosus]
MNVPFQQIKQITSYSAKWKEIPRSHGHNMKRDKSFEYLGIHVDYRLNCLENINKRGEKAIKMQQNLKGMAGSNWGISEIHRRLSVKRWLRECCPTYLQLGVSIQHTE